MTSGVKKAYNPNAKRAIVPHSFDVYTRDGGSEFVEHGSENYDDKVYGAAFGDHVYVLYQMREYRDTCEPVACCIAFEDARWLAKSGKGNRLLGRDMEHFSIVRMPKADVLEAASRNTTSADRAWMDEDLRKLFGNNQKRFERVFGPLSAPAA